MTYATSVRDCETLVWVLCHRLAGALVCGGAVAGLHRLPARAGEPAVWAAVGGLPAVVLSSFRNLVGVALAPRRVL